MEGETQHISIRGPNNFKPFLGKLHITVGYSVTAEKPSLLCLFFGVCQGWGGLLEQTTDANNNNLS